MSFLPGAVHQEPYLCDGRFTQLLYSAFVGLGSVLALFTALPHPLLKYPRNLTVFPILFWRYIAWHIIFIVVSNVPGLKLGWNGPFVNDKRCFTCSSHTGATVCPTFDCFILDAITLSCSPLVLCALLGYFYTIMCSFDSSSPHWVHVLIPWCIRFLLSPVGSHPWMHFVILFCNWLCWLLKDDDMILPQSTFSLSLSWSYFLRSILCSFLAWYAVSYVRLSLCGSFFLECVDLLAWSESVWFFAWAYQLQAMCFFAENLMPLHPLWYWFLMTVSVSSLPFHCLDVLWVIHLTFTVTGIISIISENREIASRLPLCMLQDKTFILAIAAALSVHIFTPDVVSIMWFLK